MRSLLGPLVVGLVVSLIAVFGVQWSAMRTALDAGMRTVIVEELVQDSDELLSALVFQPGDETSLAIAHFDPSFLSPSSGRYYQVIVEGAIALRSPSLVQASLPRLVAAPGERIVRDVVGPKQEMLIASASGYERDGRRVTITVAADLKAVDAQVAQLLVGYTHISLAMLVLLVALQVVIVRLALAPLRRVKADIGRLERGEIDKLDERIPSEVLPLVREVNGLLSLLSVRLKRSREAVGNLAHALKAPLTVLTHIATDASRGGDPTLRARMIEQLDTLSARINSELRRARVAGERGAGPALDLPAEIQALIGTMRKLYRDRDLDIASRIDADVRFFGDREDLLELCGNLLDNACKWARSRVIISARDGHGLAMVVEDDGPGCSERDLARISERGVRLDEETTGHGLGLSIARSVASAYGGTLAFGRSAELGGFCATVTFPRA